MEQRVEIASLTAGKCALAANCWKAGATSAVFSPVSTFGTVDSQMMTMKIMRVTIQVQVGRPFRAWVVLNQCRMVTPIRKTSAAITQL